MRLEHFLRKESQILPCSLVYERTMIRYGLPTSRASALRGAGPAVLALSDAAGLRGDYGRRRPDWTIDQPHERYTDADHALWRQLFRRQTALLPRAAAPAFTHGLAGLDIADGIPRFDSASRRLRRATGWELVAVPGLIPDDVFFTHLAHRQFPVSWWLRRPEEIDYLVEPDVFHDFFGHVPLLMDPVFADYMALYGTKGAEAIRLGAVPILSRLYWYMVEFGLIRQQGGLKAFGAGILSSHGETLWSVESPEPRRIAFDLERVMRTSYRIDRFQQTYFVIDRFEDLFEATQRAFAPLYRVLKAELPIAPGQAAEGDRAVALAA